MKARHPRWTLSKDLERAPYDEGPKAFCVGTLYPCSAKGNCRHFGVHKCSTFKKHSHKPCPHFPEHNFICTRIEDIEGGSLEEAIDNSR